MSLQPDLLGSEVEDDSHGSVHLLATGKSACHCRAAETSLLGEAVKEGVRHPKKCGVETHFKK